MGMDAAEQAELRAIIAAALHGGLTEPMARRMYAMGSEATTSVALAMNARMQQLTGVGLSPGPHTPSASIPAFAKGTTGKKRPRTPGARDGHEGRRRPAPPSIDRREEVDPLTLCPRAPR